MYVIDDIMPSTTLRAHGAPMACGIASTVPAAIDPRFRALDARTGQATPITYQGGNGKQYVAVLAGGGETRPPENPGGQMYVFALP